MKAAIFDLDGTLIDSMKVWDDIGGGYLISKGIEVPNDLNNVLRTMSFQETAEYIKNTFSLPNNNIADEIFDMVRTQYHELIPLKEGVRNALERMKDEGIKMCVATAMDHDLAKKALIRLEVLDYFEFIITCDHVGAGKRNPKIFLEAASRLGFVPADVEVFEDSVHCAKTAKAAGFKVTGVYDLSSHDDREQLQRVSDRYVMSFKELL